jgi:NitT/TauT family transport system permease protein
MTLRSPQPHKKSFPLYADATVAAALVIFLLGAITTSHLWIADFQPLTHIELSAIWLPYYTLLSFMRAFIAYALSLSFTLIIGTLAAKTAWGERLLVPILDILQSIPVFGFLPGILLTLVALFPHSNIGIELSAILCIFTSQVWNLTFCLYENLKTIPSDLKETAQTLNLNRFEKALHLELPYCASPLAWNSLLSVAGGWFFLMPCETFSLGTRNFRLPGLGAYLDTALKAQAYEQAVYALFAMAALILLLDFSIWRPILVWVQRFVPLQAEGLQASGSVEQSGSLMLFWITHSQIIRKIANFYQNHLFHNLTQLLHSLNRKYTHFQNKGPFAEGLWKPFPMLHFLNLRILGFLAVPFILGLLGWGIVSLFSQAFLTLHPVSFSQWLMLLENCLLSFGKIAICLVLLTMVLLPITLYLSSKPSRLKHAGPVLQLLASFPGSMLYTIILLTFHKLGLNFEITCIALIALAMQWYILFNILGGTAKISQELLMTLQLADASFFEKWRSLYLPSLLPSLLTGWVTAAGAGWNALVIAEFMEFNGTTFESTGIGASLRTALATNNTGLFLASLITLIVVILLINRLLWAPLYQRVLRRCEIQ